jgi:hypothetical protein
MYQVINALRENVVWQFANDPNLFLMDPTWVLGCCHVIRSLFRAQRCLTEVNTIILKSYGSHSLLSGTPTLPAAVAMSTGETVPGRVADVVHVVSTSNPVTTTDGTAVPIVITTAGKPSVYRVNNQNFVKYIGGLFRQINTEAVLGSVISAMIRRQGNAAAAAATTAGSSTSSPSDEPSVYQLSHDAFDLVLRVVESTTPGEPVQLQWFRVIGVTEHGIQVLTLIYDHFRRRSHENEIKNLVRTLGALDFELLSMFFHFLKKHSDQRLIPLDRHSALEQELALRHRHVIPPSVAQVPLHLMQACVCSIASCNELKNYVSSKTRRPLFGGLLRVAYDYDRHQLICISKKTILVRSRNEDRCANNQYTSLLDDGDDAANRNLPEFLQRLKHGDTSGLYGRFEYISKLIRLPQGTVTETAAKSNIKTATIGAVSAVKKDVARRENLERSLIPEIFERLNMYADKLREYKVDPSPGALYSLDYVARDVVARLSQMQLDDLERARSEIDLTCKKEERRIFRLKVERPCFEMPVLMVPICGYIFEKDSSRNRNASIAATLCRSCGSVFDYSLRLGYANGITCGVCDYAERRMLYAPRCFACRKSCIERCSAGQGMTTVQRELHNQLRPLVLVDDSSDWMLRVVRICNHCRYRWMYNESRYMTLGDMLRQLWDPSDASTQANAHLWKRATAPSMAMLRNADRWARRSLLLEEQSWPSREFLQALSAGLPAEDVALRYIAPRLGIEFVLPAQKAKITKRQKRMSQNMNQFSRNKLGEKK